MKLVNINFHEIDLRKHFVLLRYEGNLYQLHWANREFQFKMKGSEEKASSIPFRHKEVLCDRMIKNGGKITIYEL